MGDNQIFEIEKIGKKRKIKGKLHYLITWKFFSDKFKSYEPVENVRNFNLQNNSEELKSDENSKDLFEIDEILEEETNNGKNEYLVKWKGTKPDSWEPKEIILAMLKKYFESRKEKKNGNIETLHKFFIVSTEFDKNISD